jgi:hypothetical protein
MRKVGPVYLSGEIKAQTLKSESEAQWTHTGGGLGSG